MAVCPNCNDNNYQEGEICMVCGRGPLIGPGASGEMIPVQLTPEEEAELKARLEQFGFSENY